MSIDTKKREREQKSATIEVARIMQAAAIDRFGGPEVLTLHELPVPPLDEGEVLIALDTAGVGSWDAEMRAGWYPFGPPSFPLVLGTDGSGYVGALGPRVRGFEVGEAVYSSSFLNPKGGYYAEFVAVAAEKVAPTPKGLTMREAGAIPATGLTAIQGIDDALEIKPGESVAIVGASGGVGTLAVQFAKMRGARVLGTASGTDGVDLVRRLGADVAIDREDDDFTEALEKFAPDGLDAVLGLAGGEVLDQLVMSVKSEGRVAYPNGVEPEPKKRPGIRITPYDAVPGVRQFEHLTRAVEEAKLQVPIAGTYPLGHASQAHERIEQGHVLGKIVLEIR